MAYTKYSLTPSSNTAAPPDGAPEGMLPSAVNDTMRDMMSQIRDCGDGIRGGTYTMTAPVITGGSINGTTTITTSGAISYTGTLTGGTGVVNLGSGQFYKDANGKVGLGTSSPTAVLDVVTDSSATGISLRGRASDSVSDFSIKSNDGATVYGQIQGRSTDLRIQSNSSIPITFFTNSNERMRIDSSGNVGIGIVPSASATYKNLQLPSESFLSFSGGFGVMQNNAFFNANYKYITTAAASQYVQVAGEHLWTTAPSGTAGNAITFTERMRIDSSGNLLVGKSTTAIGTIGYRVEGTTGRFVSSLATGTFNQITHTSGTGTEFIFEFLRSTTTVGSITTSTTATAYNTSSDYRLKENIAPMTGALDRLAQLKPVTYNWKVDGSAGEGFIAHELQAVVPDCVTGEKDAVDAEGKPQYQGIDTSFLVATLVSAIQELNAEVQALKQQLGK